MSGHHVAIGGVGRGIPIDRSQPPPTLGNSRWGATESYDRAPGGEAPTLRYHHPRQQSVGYDEQGPHSGVKCYNCDGFGHKSRDCPSLTRNPNEGRDNNGGRDNRTESAGVDDSYGMQEGRGGSSYFGRARHSLSQSDSDDNSSSKVSSVRASTNWIMPAAAAHRRGNLKIGETFSCVIIQSVPPLCIWITKHAKDIGDFSECPPIECRLEKPLKDCLDCGGSVVDGACVALVKGFHGSVPVIELEYKMRHDFSTNCSRAVASGQFWEETFRGLFDGFRPSTTWILKEMSPGEMGEMRKSANKRRMDTQRETVKVRYDCETCKNRWTSRCGRILFVIDYDATRGRGTVNVTVFGQECKPCSSARRSPTVYANARCYQEEVERVLRNLYRNVGQKFFRFPKPPSYERFHRAIGGTNKPHERDHCQACKKGLCMKDLEMQLPANSGQGVARRICICHSQE